MSLPSEKIKQIAVENAIDFMKSDLSPMVKPIKENRYFHPYAPLSSFGSGVRPIRECLKEFVDAIITRDIIEMEYQLKCSNLDIDNIKKYMMLIFEVKLDLDYKK